MQTERFPTPSGCWGRKMEIGDNGMLKVFKGPKPEKKFHGVHWEPGKTGVPIIKNCIAWFELKVKERHDPGNHTLYIGEVIDCGFRSAGTALCTMDYDGMYVGMD